MTDISGFEFQKNFAWTDRLRLEYWHCCGLGFPFRSFSQLMYTLFFSVYLVTVQRQMWHQSWQYILCVREFVCKH